MGVDRHRPDYRPTLAWVESDGGPFPRLGRCTASVERSRRFRWRTSRPRSSTTASGSASTVHVGEGFAIVSREEARIHLWAATNECWRERADLRERPIASGAESFLAGTASCRIEVTEVDPLYAELAAAGVLHRASRGGVTETDFGTREFACLDLDGNLIEFFRFS